MRRGLSACATRLRDGSSLRRSGVQISADDGPTQIILPVPDRSRVTAVAIGGKDKDVLYAFCMNKIWKRKILQHAMGAWSPWTKMTGSKL